MRLSQPAEKRWNEAVDCLYLPETRDLFTETRQADKLCDAKICAGTGYIIHLLKQSSHIRFNQSYIFSSIISNT